MKNNVKKNNKKPTSKNNKITLKSLQAIEPKKSLKKTSELTKKSTNQISKNSSKKDLKESFISDINSKISKELLTHNNNNNNQSINEEISILSTLNKLNSSNEEKNSFRKKKKSPSIKIFNSSIMNKLNIDFQRNPIRLKTENFQNKSFLTKLNINNINLTHNYFNKEYSKIFTDESSFMSDIIEEDGIKKKKTIKLTKLPDKRSDDSNSVNNQNFSKAERNAVMLRRLEYTKKLQLNNNKKKFLTPNWNNTNNKERIKNKKNNKNKSSFNIVNPLISVPKEKTKENEIKTEIKEIKENEIKENEIKENEIKEKPKEKIEIKPKFFDWKKIIKIQSIFRGFYLRKVFKLKTIKKDPILENFNTSEGILNIVKGDKPVLINGIKTFPRPYSEIKVDPIWYKKKILHERKKGTMYDLKYSKQIDNYFYEGINKNFTSKLNEIVESKIIIYRSRAHFNESQTEIFMKNKMFVLLLIRNIFRGNAKFFINKLKENYLYSKNEDKLDEIEEMNINDKIKKNLLKSFYKTFGNSYKIILDINSSLENVNKN